MSEPRNMHKDLAIEGGDPQPSVPASSGGTDNTPQPGRSAAVGCIYDYNGAVKEASSLLPGYVDAGSAGSKY